MRSNKRIGGLLTLVVLTMLTSVKLAEESYLFPIKPGQRNYLSGNFCELRSSHLHAGIDIKVGGVVGAAVHATATGYVSRIKVSAGGYGNALYIQHPNGTTSVYAHLHKYNDNIQRYVKEAQYKKKSFTIELFPGKNELSVKRGEVIGKAGNSGSSGGPHLHFEIRDANQKPIDPLQFQFKEIVDNVAPYVRKISLTTLGKDSRINGQFGRFEFSVKAQGNRYVVQEPIDVYGTVGVEIAAYDKSTGVRNIYGVKRTELRLDGESQYLCDTDKFSFAQAKNIHVHTNYEERYRQNRTFYKLYVDEGNVLPFYTTNDQHGWLTVRDAEAHPVSIALTDINGNESVATFTLQGQPSPIRQLTTRYFTKPYTNKNYHVRRNVLQLFAPAHKSPEGIYEQKPAKFFANRMDYEAMPAYLVNDVAVYLWDLRDGIPDSIALADDTQQLSLKMRVPSGRAFSYYQPTMDITFARSSLFDTLYLETDYYEEDEREIFRIHEGSVPLQRNVSIALKPRFLPNEPREKMAVYSLSNAGDLGFAGGTWKGNTVTFSTRSFGNYVVATDTVPPVVTPLSVSSNRIRFKINDSMSGLSRYELRVNGEWVLMHYDYKQDLIWSDRLDESKDFTGEAELTAEDNAGNKTVFRVPIES